uniref:Uncharacterized protein n=1 Tax=Oryza punctata TaxID=4537 RepID=A0A0E0L9Y3_ORYPU
MVIVAWGLGAGEGTSPSPVSVLINPSPLQYAAAHTARNGLVAFLPVTLGQRAKEEVDGAWGHPDLVVSNHIETGSGAKELEAVERQRPGEGGIDWSMGHSNRVVPNHLETGSGAKEPRLAKRWQPVTLGGEGGGGPEILKAGGEQKRRRRGREKEAVAAGGRWGGPTAGATLGNMLRTPESLAPWSNETAPASLASSPCHRGGPALTWQGERADDAGTAPLPPPTPGAIFFSLAWSLREPHPPTAPSLPEPVRRCSCSLSTNPLL